MSQSPAANLDAGCRTSFAEKIASAKREKASNTASAAQIAANRLNATKSTGPRTAEGKARGSLNALDHGAYARRPLAIPRGIYQEDPEEVEAFVSEIIATLQPANPLAEAAGVEIARLLLNQTRLDRLQVERFAGAARLAPEPEHQDELIKRWERVAELLKADPTTVADAEWKSVIVTIAAHKGDEATLERLEAESETIDLQGVAMAVVEQYWASPEEAAQYFKDFGATRRQYFADRKAEAEDRTAEGAAQSLIDGGAFDKLSVLSGRLGKQLRRAYADFEASQARGKVGVETNPI